MSLTPVYHASALHKVRLHVFLTVGNIFFILKKFCILSELTLSPSQLVVSSCWVVIKDGPTFHAK